MQKRLVWLLATVLICFCVCCAAEEGYKVTSMDVSIVSGNGNTLRGYLQGPETIVSQGEAGRLIILMHGLMDSSEFDLIRKQADVYAGAGYAVLAMDFNGHGKSDGRMIDMTISKEL